MFLKPLLKAQLSNKWLDPTKYNNNEDFIRAYNQMHARAMAYGEIINLIEEAPNMVETVKKQIEIQSAVRKTGGII